MNLQNKFQFRLKEHPGFTHSAKAEGSIVKVKWARGWNQHINEPIVWDKLRIDTVEDWLAEGVWIIVEDKPKSKYPDLFHFISSFDKYSMHKIGDMWACTYYGKTLEEQRTINRGDLAMYNASKIEEMLRDGSWKLYIPPSLTAEQIRRNKEINSQITQLNSSIKLAEQNIELQRRLIASYEARQDDLKKGLVE